jgi:transcriptional regulator of acetoin/glycerol metabolism
MDNLAGRSGKQLRPLDQSAKQVLLSHSWPGNVRELQNVVERAFIISENGMLNFGQILLKDQSLISKDFQDQERVMTDEEMSAFQKRNLLLALNLTNWRVSGKNGAARLLHIAPSTLSSRLIKFGLQKPGLSEPTA